MSLLSFLGVSNATGAAGHATGAQHAASGGGLMSMLPMLVAFVLIFYFLLIRPQSKRAKAQRQLISDLAQGDEVVTNSGFMGKVVKLADDTVELEIADKVQIKMQKSAISTVLPKGTLKGGASARTPAKS